MILIKVDRWGANQYLLQVGGHELHHNEQVVLVVLVNCYQVHELRGVFVIWHQSKFYQRLHFSQYSAGKVGFA